MLVQEKISDPDTLLKLSGLSMRSSKSCALTCRPNSFRAIRRVGHQTSVPRGSSLSLCNGKSMTRHTTPGSRESGKAPSPRPRRLLA
jgi:hypothetical protein